MKPSLLIGLCKACEGYQLKVNLSRENFIQIGEFYTAAFARNLTCKEITLRSYIETNYVTCKCYAFRKEQKKRPNNFMNLFVSYSKRDNDTVGNFNAVKHANYCEMEYLTLNDKRNVNIKQNEAYSIIH